MVKLLDFVFSCGFQQAIGAHYVGGNEWGWIAYRAIDVRFGSKMNNHIDVFSNLAYEVFVANISNDEPMSLIFVQLSLMILPP